MAGQSGHNLSISKSKLGCRFPFESPSAGDGYAASGRCLTRPMTPEERARYGPAVALKDRDLSRGAAAFAVDNATSLEHAAKMARVSVARMKSEMARHCIAVPEGWKEDENVNDAGKIMNDSQENMDTIVQEATESPENQDPKVDEKNEEPEKVVQEQPMFYEGSSNTHRFTPERIVQAEELLSREEYIRLKNEGVSDQKIINSRDKFSYELLTALKKKWGVNIRLPHGPSKPQAKQEPPIRPEAPKVVQVELVSTMPLNIPAGIIIGEEAEAPVTQTATSGLTITRALELRDELTEDMKSWDVIHRSIIQGIELSTRVVRILEGQRDIHQQALDRINEVFERTVLPL